MRKSPFDWESVRHGACQLVGQSGPVLRRNLLGRWGHMHDLPHRSRLQWGSRVSQRYRIYMLPASVEWASLDFVFSEWRSVLRSRGIL
jgi:hypothetical protein